MARYRITFEKKGREIHKYYNSEKSAFKKWKQEHKREPLMEQKINNSNGTFFWAEYIIE